MAVYLVVCDAGYKKLFSHTRVISWDKSVKYQVRNGAIAVENVCTSNNGSVSGVDLLEDQYS